MLRQWTTLEMPDVDIVWMNYGEKCNRLWGKYLCENHNILTLVLLSANLDISVECCVFINDLFMFVTQILLFKCFKVKMLPHILCQCSIFCYIFLILRDHYNSKKKIEYRVNSRDVASFIFLQTKNPRSAIFTYFLHH